MSDRKALLKPSGVAPGTYGSASLVPVIVVDVEGRIIGLSTVSVSAGSSLADFKDSCRAATTANITLSGAQTIDGVSIIAGDRVLVKDQSTGSQNGIYVAASGSWARATDFDQDAEVTGGCVIPVSEGTSNGDKLFLLTTNDPIVVGTTALTFAAYGTGGGSGAWSGLTAPSGNLSLAMGAHLTTLTWAGDFGSNSAFKFVGANTSATGPLIDVNTGIGNVMPPLKVGSRGGQAVAVDFNNNVILGVTGGLSASATDGFPYVPFVGSSGEPSGTPTSVSGMAPLVLENDAILGEFRLWAYLSSAWRCLTPSGRLWEATSGSGARTIDWTTRGESSSRQHTMTGNSTFTFTAPAAGTLCNLILIQDATGGRTVTWPASVKWPGGAANAPDTAANAKTVYQFLFDGTNYLMLGFSAAVS